MVIQEGQWTGSSWSMTARNHRSSDAKNKTPTLPHIHSVIKFISSYSASACLWTILMFVSGWVILESLSLTYWYKDIKSWNISVRFLLHKSVGRCNNTVVKSWLGLCHKTTLSGLRKDNCLGQNKHLRTRNSVVWVKIRDVLITFVYLRYRWPIIYVSYRLLHGRYW